MQLDEYVDLFASAGSFRYRCKLCDRELFGQSRRRHAQRVHRALLKTSIIVHTRAKWQVTQRSIIDHAPAREKRQARRAKLLARMRKHLTAQEAKQ
jgi:hypothetical protein